MKKLLGILLLLSVFSVYAANNNILCSIEYFYSDDGMLIGKAINGNRINYEYDLRGQLLSVKDTNGKVLESYTYDKVGNILSKTVNGKTTTYTYDKANQLISSTIDGKTTNYKYDAAGRMIQAGSKTYRYKYLDKVAEVRENGKVIAEFEYTVEGQVSTATYGDKTEEFMWDGLALIKRNDISYLNEPYVTGGNPIIADNDVMFNDMLGNTVAISGKSVDMTAFGETENTDAMFTGKPHVAELGYAFLFRNYNSSLGKWSTSDPLGYPDGWNNFAYCNNWTIIAFDYAGGWLNIIAGAIVGATFGGISNYITSGGDWNATLSGACIGGMGGALAAIGVPASIVGALGGLTSSLAKQYSENKDILSPESVAQNLTNGLIGLGFGLISGFISDSFMITDTFWVTETQAFVNNAFFTFVTEGLLGITSSLYSDASDETIEAISNFYNRFGIEAVNWQKEFE